MVLETLNSRGHQSFERFLLPDELLDRACLAWLIVTENGFANVRQAALQVSTDYGIDSVDVGAHATAQTEGMSAAKYVAPIAVKNTHPMLAGGGCPCFGQQNETTIPVGSTGAPGAFALVNLLNGGQGTSGASTLADWIQKGFQDYLPIGGYFSDPGVKFNSNQIQDALNLRLGTEMLFPVYDTLTGQGSNAEYHVIGWVGFHIESVDAQGNNGSLTGWFTQVIWDGLAATTPTGGGPNFGAHTVQLVD